MKNDRPTIDLRQLGKIDEECEFFLAELITRSCIDDPVKYNFSMHAIEDFGLNNGNLMVYVVADLMTLQSFRYNDPETGRLFMSGGEWLNAIFNSGSVLSSEHLSIMMTFINSNTQFPLDPECVYVSGRDLWSSAPSTLKHVLDILDEAVMNNQDVNIMFPEVVPKDGYTLEQLEKMAPEEIKQHSYIRWV
jgi:hypothetical protein